MEIRVLGAAVLVACAVAAQGQATVAQEGQAALQAELGRLGAAAQSLRQDLPSFECTETGLSQAIKKDKVKEQVRFVAEVRVERGASGRLNEQLDVSEVNGKPYKRKFEPPFMVRGGFGEALFFFLPETQACFQYTLSAGRIDFVSPPGTFDRVQCRHTGAPNGFAQLDDAGNATHLERQVPHEFAEQVHVVDSTAMDFVPTELDGKVYPLTAKMVADVPKEDGVTLHFEATYTGCHLFKATSRILPGETVVPVPDTDKGTAHP
jgi:hypothetical protein